MPGPGRKTKAKPRTGTASSAASSNSQPDSFVGDIDRADGWNPVINILCEYFDLPDLDTRSGLKKVHANFESICRRLDKAYTKNASNVRIKGGIVGIYARLCVDSILRNKIFQKGFLEQLIPLLDEPQCRHLALRALTTVTHHGGVEIRLEIARSYQVLVRLLREFPDDPKTVELATVTLSHCLISTISDEGMRLDPQFAPSLDLQDVVKMVTDTLRKPAPSRTLVDHGVQLLAVSTLHCEMPQTTINFLTAGLRSRDWIFRCTCLGGLVRLHRRESEPDQRSLDPMKLMSVAYNRAPPQLNDILVAYGFPRCETYLTMKTATDYQKAMMDVVRTHDLYSLGIVLAGFILRTEFSISDGYFQSEASAHGRGTPEAVDVGLPFKMWSDALPLCAKAIRAKGLSGQAEMADILDMKFFIMRQRIPEAVTVAHTALKRNPDFAYAYYALALASDPVVGLRAAKKGMKCANITPFVRFQLMQRAVEMAGEMGITILQETASTGDRKWEEGIAFLTSALEDSKTYILEAPPDNRHMKNVLYWNILLRIAIEEEISADLREVQGSIRKLKIADDFSNWIGIPPPKTNMRLTQQTVVRIFADAAEEWGDFIATHSRPDPTPSPEKVEDDLAAWLGDMHLHDELDEHATFNTSRVELYRCSWCGNPSAVLRKCSGCEKTRYCDASCQKSGWKEHKKACVPKKAEN
ncbi:hypothetical protein C8R43DRAFT_1005813 [Mycena crocata]|nr:hypothetical protein C8R43DRAFT_1005813 [Mycena crocata]